MIISTIIDITIMPFSYFCNNYTRILNKINVSEEIFNKCLHDRAIVRLISIPISKSYYIEFTSSPKLFRNTPEELKQKYKDVVFINNFIARTDTVIRFVREKNIDIKNAEITILGDGMSVVTY